MNVCLDETTGDISEPHGPAFGSTIQKSRSTLFDHAAFGGLTPAPLGVLALLDNGGSL